MKQILGILSVIIVISAMVFVLFGKTNSNDKNQTSTTTITTNENSSVSVESTKTTSLPVTSETTTE